MAHGSVILQGESILKLSFKRTSKGLLVHARSHPAIEETFQSWSGSGGAIAANQHGRFWYPIDDAKPLLVWGLAENIPHGKVEGAVYRVDRTGTLFLEGEPEVLQRERSNPLPSSLVVNLGFLRLVGIGQPEGVQFIVRGVFSTEGIQEINRLIMAATRHLVMNYLRPVDLKFVMLAEGK